MNKLVSLTLIGAMCVAVSQPPDVYGSTDTLTAARLISPLAQPPTLTRTDAVAALDKAPLTFEPNVGQTAAVVRFLARGTAYTTLIEPTGMRLIPSEIDADRSSDE